MMNVDERHSPKRKTANSIRRESKLANNYDMDQHREDKNGRLLHYFHRPRAERPGDGVSDEQPVSFLL